MEGNGPLHGDPRMLGRLILADDPVASDATCCRLMGLVPEQVAHVREAGRFLGNIETSRIHQLAEPVIPDARPFAVLPDLRYLVRNVALP
jgi:uncharacterized protein (DUF362 family)